MIERTSRPELRVIRGGSPSRDRSLAPLTDDQEARRRELKVVLELCAAAERGRREIGLGRERRNGLRCE